VVTFSKRTGHYRRIRFITTSQAVAGDATGTASAQLLPGGTSWTTISDRNAKQNFVVVDGEEILAKLVSIPIEKWNYQWQQDSDVSNIGPMAQEFKATFYPGRNDKGISTCP